MLEVTERRKHRVGSRLPKAAQGCGDDVSAQVFERLDVAFLAFPWVMSVSMSRRILVPTCRSALSAGLVSGELEEELRRADHTGAVVHDDHAPDPLLPRRHDVFIGTGCQEGAQYAASEGPPSELI